MTAIYFRSDRDGRGGGLIKRRIGKAVVMLIFASCTLVGGAQATAIDAGVSTSQSHAGGHMNQSGLQNHRPGKSVIDKRVETLTRQLDLNQDQQAGVRKILEKGQAETNRLWSDQQISPIDRMTKLRLLRADAQKQFHTLLTEDQKKKYDETLQAEHTASLPQNSDNDKNVR